MEDNQLMFAYMNCAIIVGLTLVFFAYFSKKHTKLSSLLILVLVPTWLITAIIKGVEMKYFENSNELFSVLGFVGLLAETLPILALFGGITFKVKYHKLKKNKK